MEQLRWIKDINVDKKLIVKVIAGILILVIAFSMYMVKNAGEGESIEITAISPENTVQNKMAEDSSENVTTHSSVSAEKKIMVDISGAVNKPSVVALKEGSRVFEAIELAGGLTKDGDTRSTNLAKIMTDGEKIYIPTKKEMEASGGFNYQQVTTEQGGLININTADSAVLQKLPGVGPQTAEKIIQYRQENGNFKAIEEIKNVSGIGDKTFEKFQNKITV